MREWFAGLFSSFEAAPTKSAELGVTPESRRVCTSESPDWILLDFVERLVRDSHKSLSRTPEGAGFRRVWIESHYTTERSDGPRVAEFTQLPDDYFVQVHAIRIFGAWLLVHVANKAQ